MFKGVLSIFQNFKVCHIIVWCYWAIEPNLNLGERIDIRQHSYVLNVGKEIDQNWLSPSNENVCSLREMDWLIQMTLTSVDLEGCNTAQDCTTNEWNYLETSSKLLSSVDDQMQTSGSW